MFSMAGAAVFLPFLPMLPTQILLNNFLTVLASVGAAVLLPYTPLAAALGFVPVPASYFALLGVATALYLFIVERVKRRLFRGVFEPDAA